MALTQVSLFGDEFAVPSIDETKKALVKVNKPKTIKKEKDFSKLSLKEQMDAIRAEVYKILGKFKDNTLVIKSEEELKNYIDKAIENGIIAIDTETNNTLDTIQCKIMGLCLYTPGMKQAYVPVNHVSMEEVITGYTDTLFDKQPIFETKYTKLPWQVTEEQIKNQLSRLDGVKKIYAHANFDIEVIYSTCGIRLDAYWDIQPAAKVLNNTELKALKAQYILHIDKEQEKYEIEHLFKGLPYEIFDPELFALYAATDAYETYKVYEYQVKEFANPDKAESYKLFREIEMPVIDVVTSMELQGICVDKEYASKMSIEYHKRLDEVDKQIADEMLNLKPLIDAWRLTPEANEHPVVKSKDKNGVVKTTRQKSKSEILKEHIEFTSPKQLSILIYDILKAPVVDEEHPRGTGADIMDELANKYPICKLITDRRDVNILLTNFIDKMPELVREKTGRLHAGFNSYGTDTGRFSSSDPNLQNIPSHDKLIRMIFTASPGYSIIGADFSAQEPRSLASFSGDKAMIKAYEEGKDLYAVIGSVAFHNNYEDNLEFHPVTGVLQPDGKERRNKAKVIQLAISYNMSAQSLAESLGCSVKEAQNIIDNFYKGFPSVKSFTDESQAMLKKLGYVTDKYGRRRYIPNAQLPDYSIEPKGKANDGVLFNPLLHSVVHSDEELTRKIDEYKAQLLKCKSSKKAKELTEKADKEGIKITNNKGFINRAMRQCLNARIQGTAASMTKSAMIKIHNDPIMKKLGFRLLVTVHDEVFGEAPTENSEAAAKRLSELMVEAGKEKCGNVPWKCDGYSVKRWYQDEVSANVNKFYNDKVKSGKTEDEALNLTYDRFIMINPKYIKEMCEGTFDCNIHEDI